MGWADEVFLLDSFSTDPTVKITRQYDREIFQYRFEHYDKPCNHAISNLPIRAEWIFVLDANNWVSAGLKQEIVNRPAVAPEENGFFIRRRFIWVGK